MPLYPYQCTACGAADVRWAGLDDQFAVCHCCGQRMIRTDADPLASLRLGETPPPEAKP